MTSSIAGGSNYILLTQFFECPLTESMEYATMSHRRKTPRLFHVSSQSNI